MKNLALIQKKKKSNRTFLFDNNKIDKEIIMDRIMQALPAENGNFYIEHPIGSYSFTLKREDGRWKKALS